MAITIDWATKIISVPQADLTFVSGTLYELDTNWFRMQLKNIEDSSDGMPFERTHKHNTEVVILGTVFARVLEIINGYSITFEDAAYTVKLVGSNNNFFDTAGGILNRNQVQVIPTNSAGLIASAADRAISEDINYADGIYLDLSSSNAGTAYPTGTRTYPVNNLADAITISDARYQSKIRIAGTIALTQDVSSKELISWRNGKVDLNSQPCMATRFRNLKLYGTQHTGSVALVFGCRIGNLQNILGVFDECKFVEATPMTLQSGQTSVGGCVSQVVGFDMISLDLTAGNVELEVRALSAGLQLINMNAASDFVTAGFISGILQLDSTCTAGEVYAGGSFQIIDNSGAGCQTHLEGKNATPETVWNYERV